MFILMFLNVQICCIKPNCWFRALNFEKVSFKDLSRLCDLFLLMCHIFFVRKLDFISYLDLEYVLIKYLHLTVFFRLVTLAISST